MEFFSFTNAASLIVGTVDGVVGVSNASGGNVMT